MKKLLIVIAGIILAVLPVTSASAFPDHPIPVCSMSYLAPTTLYDTVSNLHTGFWYEAVIINPDGSQQSAPFYAVTPGWQDYFAAYTPGTYKEELYGINTKNGEFYSYTVLKTNCQVTVP